MLRYYLSLVRAIPRAFRSALEAVVFWAGGAVSLLLAINPTLWGLLPEGKPPRLASLVVLAVVFVYGLLRANYRRYRDLEERNRVLESVPSERYRILCDVQVELLGLIAYRPDNWDRSYGDFTRQRLDFWARVEDRLFPYLHEHERTKLTELFHNREAWDGTVDHAKAALHGLKNEIESWVRRDAPPLPPAPQYLQKSER